jgi:hypothetical protein
MSNRGARCSGRQIVTVGRIHPTCSAGSRPGRRPPCRAMATSLGAVTHAEVFAVDEGRDVLLADIRPHAALNSG